MMPARSGMPLISREARRLSRRGGKSKKEADRLGGGPSVRRPAWLTQVLSAIRGLGGKIAGRAIEPHLRGYLGFSPIAWARDSTKYGDLGANLTLP